MPANVVADPWRTRMLAVLLVLQCIAIGLGSIDLGADLLAHSRDEETMALTRPFWLFLQPAATYVASLGIAAGLVVALRSRGDPRRSRRALLLAFGVSLPLQVLPHLVPLSWSFSVPETLREQLTEVLDRYAAVFALERCIDIVPLLLSGTVGLWRGGLRQLRLRPDQPIGATMAFAVSAQLGLTVLAVTAVAEPLHPHAWLMRGLVLVASHFGISAMSCFLLARDGHRRHRLLRALPVLSTVALLLPGVGQLLVGLWDTEFFGHHLVAWGDRPGIVRPEQLPRHLLLFLTRSMITALAANDLLARSSDSAAS